MSVFINFMPSFVTVPAIDRHNHNVGQLAGACPYRT
jgi:hypothetical protein